MGGRTEPLTLYGPRPFVDHQLPSLVGIGGGGAPFPISYIGLDDGDLITRDGYTIRAVAVDHRLPALGYALEEPPRPGKFQVDHARTLGIPEGPFYGRLQAGDAV